MAPTTPHAARLAGGLAVVALLAGVLAGCSLIPGFPPGIAGAESSTTDSELAGTTWTGTDSDGDSWGLELQPDGTVGLTYNGDSYDDATDVWTQAGDTVTLHVGFDDGDIELIGRYDGLDAPMEAAGSYDGGGFTVTLTRE